MHRREVPAIGRSGDRHVIAVHGIVVGVKKAAVRERLSRDTIAGSALALADREGLDAVTIRRLAQDLSVTPMALYWHFQDKDALLDGIAERLFASVELPDDSGGPWDDQLRAVLDALLTALRAHPAAAGLVMAKILQSDAGLVIAERALSLLQTAGFDADRGAEMGGYLVSSIITLIKSEPGPAEPLDNQARDAAVRAKKASLLALSPERYPNVIAAAEALSFCADEDGYYRRGIDMLVQGVRGIRPRPVNA